MKKLISILMLLTLAGCATPTYKELYEVHTKLNTVSDKLDTVTKNAEKVINGHEQRLQKLEADSKKLNEAFPKSETPAPVAKPESVVKNDSKK